MKYSPRTIAPTTSDKNWINISYGGYNNCIVITGSSCLPNCTGYAWGRWRELLGTNHNLCINQAEIWFSHKDSYQRGQTPKLGAVICWSLGDPTNYKDGSGHVAIVEQIDEDGSIWISESGYSGYRFKYTHLPNNFSYPSTKLKFQGFIYIPIEFKAEKSIDELVQEVIDGKWGTGTDRKTKLLAEGYNYDEIQSKVNEILHNKEVEKIAKEVYSGKWGRGLARKNMLEAAGYNYNEIQRAANKIYRK